MASTYSALLRLELIAAGEQAGLWGNTTNSTIGSLIEQAIAGTTFISLSSTADYTLTALNGALDESRAATLVFSGTPGGATDVIIPTLQKTYFVKNGTPSTITIKTAAQTGGVDITAGNTIPVFCDGTDAFAGVTPGAIGAPETDGTGATGTWPISVTGNAGTVTNGVYTTDLSIPGAANKVPKYDSNGAFGIGITPQSTWPAGTGYGFEFGDLGAFYSSTSTTGSEFWSITARTTMLCNGYYSAAGWRNKANGNGFGGRVSAFELYPQLMRWAFSTTAPTSAGTLVELSAVMSLTQAGNLSINGILSQSSDRRLKTDIKKLTGAMTKVMKISGYTYDRIDIEGPSRQVGLMADEVKAVVPEAVTTGEDGYDRVSYGNLVALLIECVKSQERSITKMQARLRALEAK